MRKQAWVVVSLALSASAAADVGDVHYAEFDVFTGDETTVTGSLYGVPFTLEIKNSLAPDPTSFFARASSSRFDNGASAFANAAHYTPARSGTDLLALIMVAADTATGAEARLRITFDEPVSGLHVHVGGFDRSGMDFEPHGGLVSRLSGTPDLTLSGYKLFDADPGTIDERGSVRIDGASSVFEIDLYEVADLNDGFHLQLSAVEPAVVPLFGPLGLAGLALGLAGAGAGALRRRDDGG